MCIHYFNIVYNITDTPDVIPADDISQLERTVTTVIVQWRKPNYYNAPITNYTLNLCHKIEGECRNVTTNIDAGEYTNNSIVRYGSLLVIIDVVICSYLHRYNITDLQPFSSDPYQLSIRAINDIGSADFSSPVLIELVNRSEIVLVSLCVSS